MRRILALLLFFSATIPGWAQRPQAPVPSPALISPEVGTDRRVTFRYRDPSAHEVLLARDGSKPVPMQKDDQGVWSVTTDPLDPDIYSYSFRADGVTLLDPSNSLVVPNLLSRANQVYVPGPDSIPWQVNDVPHGTIHEHFYKSSVVGDNRDFFVYTPPGYDPRARQRYPVLCLLHGFSDDARAWTVVGRANVILDNLIAQRQARPMIVVMPLGYGAPEIVTRAGPGFRDPALRQRNFDKFREALLTEVIPQVEKDYRVLPNRVSWAIAGLSMGGAESLLTGLNTLDRFAWIGAFSSGGLGDDLAAQFPHLDASANARLRLLWIACGTDDGLITLNRKFRDWLNSQGVQHTDIETPGAHSWMVWRRNLAAFTPLLFQNRKP